MPDSRSKAYLNLGVCLLAGLTSLGLFMFQERIASWPDAIRAFLSAQTITKNSVDIQAPSGGYFYRYIYLFFIQACLGFTVVQWIFKKGASWRSRIGQGIRGSAGATLACAITMHLLMQTHFFIREFKQYHSKSLPDKIAFNFKNSFSFARYCQDYLPGEHNGKVITGKDLNLPEYILTYCAVAYYLYPINIRIDNAGDYDCLVIFLKDDPVKAVPEGFEAMPAYDKSSLIAIRKR